MSVESKQSYAKYNFELGGDFWFRSGSSTNIEEMALITERATADRLGYFVPEFLPRISDDYVNIQEDLENNESWVHLADSDKGLAGFAFGYLKTPQNADQKTDYLSLLMVDPEMQSRGIGRALLDVTLGISRNMNNQFMSLKTEKNNLRAQRFYTKAGFAPTGNISYRNYYTPMIEYKIKL